MDDIGILNYVGSNGVTYPKKAHLREWLECNYISASRMRLDGFLKECEASYNNSETVSIELKSYESVSGFTANFHMSSDGYEIVYTESELENLIDTLEEDRVDVNKLTTARIALAKLQNQGLKFISI